MKLVAPPAPPPLTRSEAASVLGFEPRQLSKLIAGGWIPDLTLDRVARLSRSPVLCADPGERRPVLRQAVRSRTGRDDVGIYSLMSLEEIGSQCLGWWITDARHWLAARLVPVTISGWCVAVLEIHGLAGRTDSPPVRVAFHGRCAGALPDLSQSESAILAPDLTLESNRAVVMMLGSRAPARSGGPTAYLDSQ